MKKFKVTYQNQTKLHTEEKSIEVFAHSKDQAKKTAFFQICRKGETPIRVTNNWAKAEEV